MPIRYQIERAADSGGSVGLIRTTCSGPVRLADVFEHFRRLEADPELPARLDVLLDLRGLTSLPDGEKVRSAAGEVRRLGPLVGWRACAVVAASDALFGMSRVFEVMVEPQFERTGVFRDLESAEAWLAGPAAGF